LQGFGSSPYLQQGARSLFSGGGGLTQNDRSNLNAWQISQQEYSNPYSGYTGP
jgi:hypothetical protein